MLPKRYHFAPIADLAAQHDLWLHVDAAWGGAAALVPKLRPMLHGIDVMALVQMLNWARGKW